MAESPVQMMEVDIPIAEPTKKSALPFLKLKKSDQHSIIKSMDHLDRIVFACVSKQTQRLVKSVDTRIWKYSVHMTEKDASVEMKMNELLKSKITFVIVPKTHKVFEETKKEDIYKGSVNGREILFCYNVESISIFGIFTIKIERFYIGLPVTVHNVIWLIDFLHDTIPSEKITWSLPLCQNKPVDLQLLYEFPLFKKHSDILVHFKTVNFYYTFLNEVMPEKLSVIAEMPEDFEHENALKIKDVFYEDARWIHVDHLIFNLECESLEMSQSIIRWRHLNLFFMSWLHKGNPTLRKLQFRVGLSIEEIWKFYESKKKTMFETDPTFRNLAFVGRKGLHDSYLLATRYDQEGRELEVISVVFYDETKISIRMHTKREFENETQIIRMVYEKNDIEKALLHTNVHLEIEEMQDESETKTMKLEELRAGKTMLEAQLTEIKKNLETAGANLGTDGFYLV